MQAIADYYGAANAVTFDCIMLVKPEEGDSITFKISAWVDAENNIAIRMSKLGFQFLHGHFAADGSFTARLIRNKSWIQSTLTEMDATLIKEHNLKQSSGLFTGLSLLCNEIKRGPLPYAPHYTHIEGRSYSCSLNTHTETHADDQTAIFTVADDGQSLTSKRLFNIRNEELLHLQYKRTREMDGLMRPKSLSFSIPNDNSTYKISVKKFRTVPQINPSRYNVSRADDELTMTEFIKQLTATDQQ